MHRTLTTAEAMQAGRPHFYTVEPLGQRGSGWGVFEHYETGAYCYATARRKVNAIRRARLNACGKVSSSFGSRCDLRKGHAGCCGGSLVREAR